ncbi:MAG: DNA polymerase-3 subunit gamma/tau [Candidatus Azotimanducaceae bacterium]|jgi:DNA polymerase-3 subunit gamma/tau
MGAAANTLVPSLMQCQWLRICDESQANTPYNLHLVFAAIQIGMSYQVLARKYRPANFEELEGQEHVRRALVNALEKNRLHHAYLFTGTRGTGKTTIARIFAKCLNCDEGITATPCGVCGSCQEISQGRSVDLIEVDAASRTGVDSTRELLDNVQYMPTRSRFKVYLIDEVHMFSTSSFNALLKTLEEPPEHVKFLLATTDPKKLPVTVLSRCLQFNLKNLAPERVVSYLTSILDKEQIEYEQQALWLLGRAADGSMRDALSLTDQAISFGDQRILDADVKSMLGAIDQLEIHRIIDALIEHDGAKLLEQIARMGEYAPDYGGLLADILSLLHRVAVAQALPDGIDNSQGDREEIMAIAGRLNREDVQLFYQIGLIGQRDLALAPDPRTGFEMVLLRMLAFVPNVEHTNSAIPAPVVQEASVPAKKSDDPAPQRGPDIQGAAQEPPRSAVMPNQSREDVSEKMPEKPAIARPSGGSDDPRAQSVRTAAVALSVAASKSPAVTPTMIPAMPTVPMSATSASTRSSKAATPAITTNPAALPTLDAVDTAITHLPLAAEHWTDIFPQLRLTGVTQSVASNCELEAVESDVCRLVLSEKHSSLWNNTHQGRIVESLSRLYGRPIRLTLRVGATEAETPAGAELRRRGERQAEAELAIDADEKLKQLIDNFDGTLERDTIAPRNTS